MSSMSASQYPRLWCIPATKASVVAVIAKLYGTPRWTCILRWDWRVGTLDEGAWTRLDVRPTQSYLSACGRYFCYAAKGGTASPFDPTGGGGYTISRLPWLSALTDPIVDCLGSQRKSVHAGSSKDQEALWRKVSSDNWRSADWTDALGPNWTIVLNNKAALRLGALGIDPGLSLAVMPGVGWRLIVAADLRKDDWAKTPRFFVLPETPDGGSAAPIPLSNARWARATPDGSLLIADASATLKVVRLITDSAGCSSLYTVFEHSLAALVPRPGPSPDWAKRRVSSS